MKRNQYEYFFQGEPEAEKEFKALGLSLEAVDVGEDEPWPAIIMPSGYGLLIKSDDEGNGPGSIEIIK